MFYLDLNDQRACAADVYIELCVKNVSGLKQMWHKENIIFCVKQSYDPSCGHYCYLSLLLLFMQMTLLMITSTLTPASLYKISNSSFTLRTLWDHLLLLWSLHWIALKHRKRKEKDSKCSWSSINLNCHLKSKTSTEKYSLWPFLMGSLSGLVKKFFCNPPMAARVHTLMLFSTTVSLPRLMTLFVCCFFVDDPAMWASSPMGISNGFY